MAPSKDDPQNAFESFRRFADEQVSFLVRGLTGQPPQGRKPTSSESSESDEDLPWIVRGMSEEARRRYRNAQREMNDYISAEKAAFERPEAQVDETRCPYRPADPEASERKQSPTYESIRERAEEAQCPAFIGYEPSTPLSDSEDVQADPTWPLAYLAASSYSPLCLEQQEQLQDHGQKWRQAFEELIAIESGANMDDTVPTRSEQCATHWIGSMMNRGLFSTPEQKWSRLGVSEDDYRGVLRLLRAHEQNKRLGRYGKEMDEDEEAFDDDEADNDYEPDDDEEEQEDEEDDMTELDLYERLLGVRSPFFDIQKMASQAFREKSEMSTPNAHSSENGKPSIISTLTTTERTTLPDGSIHTKMVLKKRFADGREENTETTHTTKDQQVAPQRRLNEIAATGKNETAAEGERSDLKTKGWFWS